MLCVCQRNHLGAGHRFRTYVLPIAQQRHIPLRLGQAGWQHKSQPHTGRDRQAARALLAQCCTRCHVLLQLAQCLPPVPCQAAVQVALQLLCCSERRLHGSAACGGLGGRAGLQLQHLRRDCCEAGAASCHPKSKTGIQVAAAPQMQQSVDTHFCSWPRQQRLWRQPGFHARQQVVPAGADARRCSSSGDSLRRLLKRASWQPHGRGCPVMQ